MSKTVFMTRSPHCTECRAVLSLLFSVNRVEARVRNRGGVDRVVHFVVGGRGMEQSHGEDGRRRIENFPIAHRAVGIVLLFGFYSSPYSNELLLWHSGTLLGWALVALAIAGFLIHVGAGWLLGRLWSSGVA
jgi:hypothetical protein